MKAILGIFIISLALHCGAKGGNTNNILYAVDSGNLDMVKHFFATNSTPFSSKESAGLLTSAAVHGQTEMAAFLISKGADVNEKGFYGMPPLASMGSAFNSPNDVQFADIATLLIAHGATVDAVDNYQDTPLMHAVESENYHLAEVLIKNGANQRVTYGGTYGSMTPLHMAILHGNSEQVAMLLKYNPPLDAVDGDGRTPLLLAEQYDKTNAAAMIREISHDTNVIPSLADMRAIGKRIANGDESAINDLAKVDDDLRQHIKPNHNQYPHVPDPWIMIKLGRINTALNVVGEEAGNGNEKALHALEKCLGMRLGDVPRALGIAAAAGNKEALDMLLNYNKWGIDNLSANFSLCLPAEANVEPAVDYFVAWLNSDKPYQTGVGEVMDVTNALTSAAAKGNKKAQAALEKFASLSEAKN